MFVFFIPSHWLVTIKCFLSMMSYQESSAFTLLFSMYKIPIYKKLFSYSYFQAVMDPVIEFIIYIIIYCGCMLSNHWTCNGLIVLALCKIIKSIQEPYCWDCLYIYSFLFRTRNRFTTNEKQLQSMMTDCVVIK